MARRFHLHPSPGNEFRDEVRVSLIDEATHFRSHQFTAGFRLASWTLPYVSVDELYRAVDDYIFWYNNTRLQKRFKGLTPMQYRNQTLETLTT